MSPGATFERVYHDIKRMLAEGELPPGTPIEPAMLGKEIASSITPIRDALHRLTGERLVEAPNHNGFRVPLPTEAALRDLYDWNAQLLGLAARRVRSSPPRSLLTNITRDADLVAAIARLFVDIANATGSPEHVRATQNLNDRLAPFRRLEAQILGDVGAEADLLATFHSKGDRTQLIKLLGQYHRRRMKIVPALLAER
ncbi:GntR family transcriptional regulator [Sphingomonas qomolangmaensis]|uniref:GntR family transcriptional regulator n=1 Tax=Sphingomonas qomolangmaensis TaxID=2918765 RepID=A0ABY5LA99_9SPHN|nr:GntR family transcriptional regulator [Sphingomonas qomolangmaensis]UUL82548.1 GntR family transcriptional regulator [Sphingomonas qomolangmaensis]